MISQYQESIVVYIILTFVRFTLFLPLWTIQQYYSIIKIQLCLHTMTFFNSHTGNIKRHKVAITDNRFPILYYQFNCSGDEPSLDHCPNISISEEYFTPCYDEVVYIICERKSTGFSRKYLV